MEKQQPADRTITVRLDPDALTDFRALREWLGGRIPVGVRLTATTVVRSALALAITHIEESSSVQNEAGTPRQFPPGAVGVRFPREG